MRADKMYMMRYCYYIFYLEKTALYHGQYELYHYYFCSRQNATHPLTRNRASSRIHCAAECTTRHMCDGFTPGIHGGDEPCNLKTANSTVIAYKRSLGIHCSHQKMLQILHVME